MGDCFDKWRYFYKSKERSWHLYTSSAMQIKVSWHRGTDELIGIIINAVLMMLQPGEGLKD
jgi:hypothetical protein